MKKIVLIFLLLQMICFLQAYTIESISGEENVKEVIDSKPVYMVFTANNVIIWKESYEKLVKDEISKGNKMLSFNEMKEKMYNNFSQSVKMKGKKWEMEMINNISEAKNGYIIHINVDQVVPAPMAGLTARYGIKAYKAGNNNALFTAVMKITQISGICTIPRCALASTGDMLGEEFFGFMRRGK